MTFIRIIAAAALSFCAIAARAQPVVWQHDEPGRYVGPEISAPRGGRIASAVFEAPTGSHLSLRDTATGLPLWTVRGPNTSAHPGKRIAVDAEGNVIVALSSGANVLTVKYAAVDGAVLWGHVHVDEPLTLGMVGSLAIDSGGGVIVGAATCSQVYEECRVEHWIEKHDAQSGAVLWHASHSFGFSDHGMFPGAAVSVATDSARNVLAAGGQVIAKYAAETGVALWSVPVAIPPASQQVVVVDLHDDAMVLVSDASGARVMKVSGSDGSTMWSTPVPGATKIVLASNGDAIVAGGAFTRRLSGANGAVSWARKLAGVTRDLAMDADGNVVAARQGFGNDGAPRARIVRYEGSSGRVLSIFAVEDGTESTAEAIAADGAGIYACVSITTNNPSSGSTARTAMFTNTATIVPGVLDFNADGRSDLTWSHPDGRHALWLVDGLSVLATGEVSAPAAGVSITGIADFDGDGRADLLFQHPNGEISLSLVSGTLATAASTLVSNHDGWHVAAAGDLDGDGRADVVLQNADGRVFAWTRILAGGVGSYILDAGTGWVVSHLADFDGDGLDDILFRHPDGRHAIWLMDGKTPKSQAQILNAGGWTAMHALDLNGDGTADILWQHADGTIAAWLMNGTSMASGATLIGPGSGWSVTHTGDFDGDGKSDLLFTHDDGRVAIYLMNGLMPAQTTQILNAGSGWSVRRLLDLDGDGRADIVWQHTDGSVAAWLMNGTAMTSGSTLLGPGTGWSVSTANP
ncbi:hypothetical protein BWI17_14665 [Betaproteobacteria bacterium GR16-43]|nr:hypothetical protein BWI17_14665 [Betaproteobacteria bacterium GR16-43]